VSARPVGYFKPGSSWLHRRHPLTKLLALISIAIAAFIVPPLGLPVLTAVLLVAAVTTGLLVPLLRSLRIPAVLFASIFLVNAFFYPGDIDRIFAFGPVGLSWDGIVFGLLAAARIFVVFVASILFLFTTLPDDLLEGLVAKGASHRIAFVVLSAIQLVPRLQARAASIQDAQQARGLRVTGSFVTRVRALVPLVGPVVLGSLIDVRERTLALEARGFGARPERTAYRVVVDPPADRWLRVAIIGALILLLVGVFSGVLRQ
jgi:energy-coupling factor transport system permease protein